ncbi:MAG: NAD(P)/FAD-dependent oxidoreductase [Bacilli bacterium]|jgi:thioredoxin reductase (NADPH)|nr:NAD(P)/FAD-dependent oxidoreductase [Bacilli bacterium]
MRYDIAIVGTGPAGISAAITSKIRNKNLILIGSKTLSSKISQGHTIENYPGLPEISGEELAKRFLDHLKVLNVSITEGKVAEIYPMEGYYVLQVGTEMIEASSVILATGATLEKPYPGEEELVGRGVSYCATCDASLYKGKEVAVLCSDPEEEKEAEFLAEKSLVTFYPLYPTTPAFTHKIAIRQEKPISLAKADKKVMLTTSAGTSAYDGVFILRKAISPKRLVPGLLTDGPRVVVDRGMSTNLPGLFAAGDITGTPYQYVKSAGEGNVAALSAVAYLSKLTK